MGSTSPCNFLQRNSLYVCLSVWFLEWHPASALALNAVAGKNNHPIPVLRSTSEICKQSWGWGWFTVANPFSVPGRTVDQNGLIWAQNGLIWAQNGLKMGSKCFNGNKSSNNQRGRLCPPQYYKPPPRIFRPWTALPGCLVCCCQPIYIILGFHYRDGFAVCEPICQN